MRSDLVLDLRSDFPSTHGDGRGSIIDWSGVTGVAICLTCNAVSGPWITLDDTNAGAAEHRASHSYMDPIKKLPRTGVNAEAIEASKTDKCIECGTTSGRMVKWRCAGCRTTAVNAWRVICLQTCVGPECLRAIAHVSTALCRRHGIQKANNRPLTVLDATTPIPHGTAGGYQYHACRCDPCRAAGVEASRKHRAAVKKHKEKKAAKNA